MRVSQIANLASRAFAKLWRAGDIPIRMGRSPGPRTAWPSRVPRVAITPSPTAVTVTCSVPGATAANVLVSYDDEENSFAVRVARAGVGRASADTTAEAEADATADAEVTADADWYVELPMPLVVDGDRSVCTLEGETLLIRAPLDDLPGLTGLGLSTVFEEAMLKPAPLALTH